MKQPPAVATRLLERLGVSDALVGDLFERYQSHSNPTWYVGQVLWIVASDVTNDLLRHKWLAFRAIFLTQLFFFAWRRTVSTLLEATSTAAYRLIFNSETLRWLWFYYQVPRLTALCVGTVIAGWLVAKLHRRHEVAMVFVSAASMWCWYCPWAMLFALSTMRIIRPDPYDLTLDRLLLMFMNVAVTLVIMPIGFVVGLLLADSSRRTLLIAAPE